MSNEVLQYGVLVRVFLEIGGNSNLEYFSSKQVEGLVEPCRSFSIGNTVEDVLSSFSMDDVHSDWVSSIRLVLR